MSEMVALFARPLHRLCTAFAPPAHRLRTASKLPDCLARAKPERLSQLDGLRRCDAMTDRFEPGMTCAQRDRVFGDVRQWGQARETVLEAGRLDASTHPFSRPSCEPEPELRDATGQPPGFCAVAGTPTNWPIRARGEPLNPAHFKAHLQARYLG